MNYTIIGLRETGELACYDRSAPKSTLEQVEQICHNFSYSQLLVVENKMGGYFQRYAYDRLPRIREVPLKRE